MWARLTSLPAGAWIAFGVLALAVALGWAVALNRIATRLDAWLGERRPARKRKKEGRGLKVLGLVFLAILPGGLVGTAAAALIVGKKDWRRDALILQAWSLPLLLLLAWLSRPDCVWPAVAENVFVTGTLGLTAGLLEFWAMLKLLREAWGEPERKVSWWPPLALWGQTLLLAGAAWLFTA